MRYLDYNGKEIVVKWDYDDPGFAQIKGRVKSAPGRRYNPDRKCWTLPPSTATLLAQKLEDCEFQQSEAFKALVAEKAEAKEASRAVAVDMDIPAPEGLDYRPFQKAGITYAQGKEHCLIGDDMGLGKTIQAIGLVNLDPEIKQILVICPAFLKLNWGNEARRWLVRDCEVMIADSKARAAPPGDKDRMVIVNYDILEKLPWLKETNWDLLIVDECHYLKNPKAKRTAAVFGKYSKDVSKRIDPIPASRRVYLTGTPLVNRPIELWPLLRFSGIFKSWKHYVERYCAGHKNRFGWDVSGASNLGELQEILRSNFMIRRLKQDVLAELPAKQRQVIEIPANGCQGVIDAENDLWEEYREHMADLRLRVELAKAGDDDDEYAKAVKALRNGLSVAFTEMARARIETARAKLPRLIEYIREAIEQSGKVVAFTVHHEITDALAEEFGSECVAVDGRSSQEDRQAAVERFQADTNTKLFIGGIKATGVGITLTASKHVIFCELDWVPGNLSQAEDRCYGRVNDPHGVLAQHIVLEGSIDAKMAKMIVDKQETIDQALDREPEQKQEELDTPVIPAEDTAPASDRITRPGLAKQAEALTEADIQEIHKRLKFLALRDWDGTRLLNDIGFNRYDSRLGHDLANRERLTPKQAALGKVITHKYRRQLHEGGFEVDA